MSYNRRATRQHLEIDVKSPSCRSRLQLLKKSNPAFGGFQAWEDVCAFLLDRDASQSHKDAILTGIIRQLQRRAEASWQAILILAFWPALCSLSRQCQHWDTDSGTLWDNLVWEFLMAVRDLDIVGLATGIAGRVVRSTRDRLRSTYRRTWARNRRELSTGAEASLFRSTPVESEREAETNERSRALIRLIERAVGRGLISAAELRLIAEVDYHGLPLELIADRDAVSYEAVKKRRQRLLEKIRRLVRGDEIP